MSFFSTPSLASATATRVDSACKHHQQCRISYDHMLDFVGSAVERERDKMLYCVHKDELVVGIDRPWIHERVRKLPLSANPRVLSALGKISSSSDYSVPLKMIKYLYHFSTSLQKRKLILTQMNTQPNTVAHTPLNGRPHYFLDDANNRLDLIPHLEKMYDFYPMGFATTLGYAHPNSGDTMTTVMIGGLRTVMNGDFEVFAGDTIQWYWDFERNCFHDDGRRKAITNAAGAVCDGNDPEYDYSNAGGPVAPGILDPHRQARRNFNDLQYGVDRAKKAPASKAQNVARIKPYVRDDDQPRIYDWLRVFAVAISSARPNEMIDIKICRQSM